MAKSNYQRKSEVLSNGDYDCYRFTRQTIQSSYRDIPLDDKNPFATLDEAIAFDEWKKQYDSENWKECERLDHARVSRVCRLRKKVRYMIFKFECCFATLTFTDEVLERTSPETRHTYVSRFLKQFPCGIANVDYGDKTQREHYHAIIPVPKITSDMWKYGFVFGRKLKKADNLSADKVAYYTAKLVNHAIKETTKGCRTIYSGYFGLSTPKDHVPKWIDDSGLYEKYNEHDDGLYPDDVFIDIPDEIKSELDKLFGSDTNEKRSSLHD